MIAQTITTTGTLVAVNTTYGTASAETSFTVEGPGTLFTNDILVTAPTGYEVSLTSGSGFGATVTAPLAINTVPLVTVYVRLKADATVLGGPYAGNIVLTSTGALNTPHNVATVSSTVSPKAITISAPTIAPKVYDGTTAAGVVALGTVTGLVGAEALTITPSATAYSSANVGAAYTSTVSYAIADGTGLAANYSALANDNLTGLSITQKLLTVTANAASKLHGAVLVNPTVGSTAFSSTGLVSGETIGSVTLSYSGGVDTAGAPLGVYAGTIFPSAPVGGTFLLSNYAFVPAPGTMTIIPNTNAYLSNLVSSTGALNTAFNRNDIDYETYVLIAVNSLTVTPTTENQYATVQVRINNTGFSPEPYVTVASGAASPVMTLQEGDNMIDITVTAEDGVTIINYRIK
ncbi:MAG: hypothetical protein B7Y11_14095, partial [Sphingobacteriia bacterium 24-36-13]